MHTDFELRTIVDPETAACALAFVAESQQAAQTFLGLLIETIYPPGGRGSSHLWLTTTPPGSVVLSATSDDKTAEIAVAGIAANVAEAVRTSLHKFGGVAIVFGQIAPHGFALLKPSENYLAQHQATIDGETIHGLGFDQTALKELLGLLDEESS